MLDPGSGGRTSPSASSAPTERSALLEQPGPKVVYGTDISHSDSEYGSSGSSSLLSPPGDEEASINSNVKPTEAEGIETQEPLSSRAILWIVLPMLLGQYLSCSRDLRSALTHPKQSRLHRQRRRIDSNGDTRCHRLRVPGTRVLELAVHGVHASIDGDADHLRPAQRDLREEVDHHTLLRGLWPGLPHRRSRAVHADRHRREGHIRGRQRGVERARVVGHHGPASYARSRYLEVICQCRRCERTVYWWAPWRLAG